MSHVIAKLTALECAEMLFAITELSATQLFLLTLPKGTLWGGNASGQGERGREALLFSGRDNVGRLLFGSSRWKCSQAEVVLLGA